MADHSITVTLKIRQDSRADWISRDPILAAGEYGLETDTYLIKIGDGVRHWTHLPYLNKLNSEYFKQEQDGSLTFSDSFLQMLDILEAAAGNAIDHLVISDQPVNDTDAANKKYVDDAIAAAGHLKREIVQELPTIAEADPNTMYMVPAQSGNYYEEYMIVNNAWEMIGQTGDGGSGGFTLQIATASRLGGVKSSVLRDHIAVNPNTGFMTLNEVSTTLLRVPDDDTLTIYGGTA